ncbi:MAG: putative zinc-binding protein [Burkholderiales bacterium]
MTTNPDLPLVYSCSGYSSAAQMANYLALRLDRIGAAEMSCIAGVGGAVPHLVRIARSGRPIVAIDGCQLVCTASCLGRQGLQPVLHRVLSDHGVRKRYHTEFDEREAQRLLSELLPAVEHARRGARELPALPGGAGADGGAPGGHR